MWKKLEFLYFTNSMIDVWRYLELQFQVDTPHHALLQIASNMLLSSDVTGDVRPVLKVTEVGFEGFWKFGLLYLQISKWISLLHQYYHNCTIHQNFPTQLSALQYYVIHSIICLTTERKQQVCPKPSTSIITLISNIVPRSSRGSSPVLPWRTRVGEAIWISPNHLLCAHNYDIASIYITKQSKPPPPPLFSKTKKTST